MSLTITIRAEGIAGVDAALKRLSPLDSAVLMNRLARLIQIQTKRRIEDEKTSPEGETWKPNRAGKPILYRSGALSGSIQATSTNTQVIAGSGLPYAAIHQFGGTIVPKKAKRLAFRVGDQMVFAKKVTIPARPYLGVSAENGREILEETAAYIRRKLG